VAAGVAALTALPAAVGALPVDDIDVDAATLLARVQTSDDVAYSAYGEARGDLVLPDVDALGDLPDLISGTTRLRAWWRGRDDFRVDALTLVGEVDVITAPGGTWMWVSADRAATLVRGDVDVRLPRGADLLPPALGARLSRAAAVQATRLPARRVAGVDAAGLRLVPTDPASTTVERVDLWAEPETGLPLRVEVHAVGVEDAALTSLLLDLSLSAPNAERTTFTPPPDATVTVTDAPDVAAVADRFAPFALPAELAGLPRRQRVDDVGEGVASYGDGLTVLTVVPLPLDAARGLVRELADRDRVTGQGPDEAQIATALLQGLVARRGDRAYLLVGTVRQPVLRQALAALAAAPPPVRPDAVPR
jgi:hypothetical protein